MIASKHDPVKAFYKNSPPKMERNFCDCASVDRAATNLNKVYISIH
nr:MAG TPA: hypothetical protein [Caudoviricetes sp.]